MINYTITTRRLRELVSNNEVDSFTDSDLMEEEGFIDSDTMEENSFMDSNLMDEEDSEDLGLIINSHSYKPGPKFYGSDSEIYFGIELELESKSSQEAIFDSGFNRSEFYFKKDGSLNYGVEVVSHPGTYEYWMNRNWEAWLDSAVKLGFRVEDTCGLHIHISREALTEREWLRAGYFVSTHKDFVEESGRRRNQRYAIIKNKEFEESGHSDDRYEAINFTNAETVELRFFASTVKGRDVRRAIHWARALVKYAKLASDEVAMSPKRSLALFKRIYNKVLSEDISANTKWLVLGK